VHAEKGALKMTTENIEQIQAKYGLNFYTNMNYDYGKIKVQNKKKKVIKRVGKLNVFDFIEKTSLIKNKKRKIEQFKLMQEAFKGSLNFTFKEYTNGEWTIAANFYYVPVYEDLYLALAQSLNPKLTKEIQTEVKKREVKKLFIKDKKELSLYTPEMNLETKEKVTKRVKAMKSLMMKDAKQMMEEIEEVKKNA
jgi:predicted nucleic acid-binding protein